jgi:transposase
MKKNSRRKFAPAFKAKEALEAVKNQKTLAELAKFFDVNPIMISRWKAELLANMGSVFEKSGKSEEPDVDTRELYAQIGQLRVENEFLKKSFKRLGG